MSSRKVQVTKNYRLFQRSPENRPTDVKKHKRLIESMTLYGFLPCFPIVCVRDSKQNLIVKDGQHRLAIAESLGLAIYWIEETTDFDIAVINCTSLVWALNDYARKFAANGLHVYQVGLDFAQQHGLPVGTAFALLGGTTSFNNLKDAFVSGTFTVKDRKWADAVAGLYGPLVSLSPVKQNARLIEACMAVCRVPEFDAKRMLQNAEKCREKLVAYATREAYLDMLEAVYNYGRRQLFALKIQAITVMRERDIIQKRKPSMNGQPKKASAPNQVHA